MSEYISVAKLNFNTYKTLADKAISSLTEEEIHFKLETNENSVAIIMQHLIGNARSRFTDFFNSDGEKENRNRDSEFIEKELSKEEAMRILKNQKNALMSISQAGNTDDDLDLEIPSFAHFSSVKHRAIIKQRQ